MFEHPADKWGISVTNRDTKENVYLRFEMSNENKLGKEVMVKIHTEKDPRLKHVIAHMIVKKQGSRSATNTMLVFPSEVKKSLSKGEMATIREGWKRICRLEQSIEEPYSYRKKDKYEHGKKGRYIQKTTR